MPNSEPNLDESGEPIRLGRTPGGFTQVGGGFGGGGGGVGGGGGGFGGGGLGFAFAPGGLGGSGMAGLRERRRKGFIPGVTPGAPQPSDTVPAMLTPGEIVMNNGVTSDPQLARALMALNMAGAQRMMAAEPQGYAFGGMALMNPMTMVMRNQATQGFAFGGMVNAARMQRAMQMAAQQQAMGGGRYNKMLGALRRVPGMAGYAAPAPQQAPAPMPMNPGEAYAQQPAPMPGMAYGGLVPGFALGGMAGFGGGSSSMYGGMRQRMNNMPPPPAGSPQRLTSGTSSGDAATMTNGRYATTDPNKNSKDYWRDAQGIVRDRNGNVYSYNPDKPWESMTGSYDPGSRGISQRLIGRFGEAGYFDPEGNRALMDSVRAEALSNARATQQGAALRAQLAGMDPGAAASYRMEAGLRGSGDVARALNAARLQSMLQQQQLANAMLREDQGFGYGIYSALNQANLQNRNAAESDKRANSGGFMGGLGQLVGAGVGSMFGPAGTALGTAAGKKLFG